MSKFRLQEDKVSTGMGMARCGLCTSTDEGQHKRVERCKKELQRRSQTLVSFATKTCCRAHGS